MTEDEKYFEEEWGKYHALLYGYGDKYTPAKFYCMESRRTLREQIKSDLYKEKKEGQKKGYIAIGNVGTYHKGYL